MNRTRRGGFRGYIVSRELREVHISQQLQNLVVRDFAERHGLYYLLSGTEHAMPHCYMILEGILRELPDLDGIIFVSVFALPLSVQRRSAVYERIFSAEAVVYFALENLVISSPEESLAVERLLSCSRLLTEVPFNGRYNKTGGARFESCDTANNLLAAGEWNGKSES